MFSFWLDEYELSRALDQLDRDVVVAMRVQQNNSNPRYVSMDF